MRRNIPIDPKTGRAHLDCLLQGSDVLQPVAHAPVQPCQRAEATLSDMGTQIRKSRSKTFSGMSRVDMTRTERDLRAVSI